MNSFKVSNPAEHFLDRRRVLITSPEGKTMVCSQCYLLPLKAGHPSSDILRLGTTLPWQSHTALRSLRTKYALLPRWRCERNSLPEHPVAIIPPMVAPRPGSNYARGESVAPTETVWMIVPYRKE